MSPLGAVELDRDCVTSLSVQLGILYTPATAQQTLYQLSQTASTDTVKSSHKRLVLMQ